MKSIESKLSQKTFNKMSNTDTKRGCVAYSLPN